MRRLPIDIGIIHFVGIGGIGMSGIAEILHNLEYEVQGSDISENPNVGRLIKLGIPVFIGQTSKNIDNVSIVVISTAIKSNNPELIEGASIICFHGEPNPEQAITETVRPWGTKYEPRKWVAEHWRM